MIDPVIEDLNRYLAEQDREQAIATKEGEYFELYCEPECRKCQWLNIFNECIDDFQPIAEMRRCPNGCWDLDDAHI